MFKTLLPALRDGEKKENMKSRSLAIPPAAQTRIRTPFNSPSVCFFGGP